MNNLKQSAITGMAQYGNMMVPAKNVALLRGSGLYNPSPIYPQSTDRGAAYSSALLISEVDNEQDSGKNPNDKWPQPYSSLDDMNKQAYVIGANFHPEEPNSWNRPMYKESQGSDMYQAYAIKATNTTPNPLLNYFFMKDNVDHIQSSLKSSIKEIRDITIGDQNTDKLLTIMLNKYQYAVKGGYLPLSEDDTVYPRGSPDGSPIKGKDGKMIGRSAYWSNTDGDNTCMSLEYQISKLNQAVVEECIKQILSGIDAYKRYYRDASSLPMPNDRSVLTSLKGSNVLQENLGFYSSHAINKDISSYSQRFNVI